MNLSLSRILGTFLLGADRPSQKIGGTFALVIKKQILTTAVIIPHRRTNFIKQVLGHFLFGSNTPPPIGTRHAVATLALVIKKQTVTASATRTVPTYIGDLVLTLRKQLVSIQADTVRHYYADSDLLIKKQQLLAHAVVVSPAYSISAALIIKKQLLTASAKVVDYVADLAIGIPKQLVIITGTSTTPQTHIIANLVIKKQVLSGKISMRNGTSIVPQPWITDYIVRNVKKTEIPSYILWPSDSVVIAPENVYTSISKENDIEVSADAAVDYVPDI